MFSPLGDGFIWMKDLHIHRGKEINGKKKKKKMGKLCTSACGRQINSLVVKAADTNQNPIYMDYRLMSLSSTVLKRLFSNIKIWERGLFSKNPAQGPPWIEEVSNYRTDHSATVETKWAGTNQEVRTTPERAPSTSNYTGPGLLFVKHQQVIPRALWRPCPPTRLLWCKPGPRLSSRPSFSSCPQIPLLWDYLWDSLFLPNIPPPRCHRKRFCVDWKLDFLEDVTNLIVVSSEQGESCTVPDPQCTPSTAPPSPLGSCLSFRLCAPASHSLSPACHQRPWPRPYFADGFTTS